MERVHLTKSQDKQSSTPFTNLWLRLVLYQKIKNYYFDWNQRFGQTNLVQLIWSLSVQLCRFVIKIFYFPNFCQLSIIVLALSKSLIIPSFSNHQSVIGPPTLILVWQVLTCWESELWTWQNNLILVELLPPTFLWSQI